MDEYLREKDFHVDSLTGLTGEARTKRCRQLIQEYNLTFKLDMIAQLPPIDARAFSEFRQHEHKSTRVTHQKKLHAGLVMQTPKKQLKLPSAANFFTAAGGGGAAAASGAVAGGGAAAAGVDQNKKKGTDAGASYKRDGR